MVEFLNCFGVKPGGKQEFFTVWLEVNTYMRAKPGYVGHTLYRSLSPDATYRYVNTAQWESAQACQEAHDQGFRELAGALAQQGVTSTPSPYELVHDGRQPTIRLAYC